MTIESATVPMLIMSDCYIDMVQSVQCPGFEADLKTYVTNFVWERYIIWSVGDDHSFNVHQTQQERQDLIIKDVISRLSTFNKKDPEKDLFFYRKIIVRNLYLAEPELALFKLNVVRNEYDDVCLIIDAVNIT